MATPKIGVSSATLANLLPIGSYQTAWTMTSKFRAAIHAAPKAKLSGTVEVDEWFHGGVTKGGNAYTGKNLVIAAVEVGSAGWGRVRMAVIPNRGQWAIRKFIRENVEPGTHVITDGHVSYPKALAGLDMTHESRNESAPNAPAAHTLLPAVHRVFSQAERMFLGTFNGGVQREHLPEYLSEFTFRWNRRNSGERGLVFMRLLQAGVGAAPVPYKDLVKIGAVPEVTPAPPGARSRRIPRCRASRPAAPAPGAAHGSR